MAKAKTVGFAISEEDLKILDDLAAYFGNGNRSEYLRATFKVMRSVKRAEELRRLQAYGQQRLAAQGWTVDDVPRLVREALAERRGSAAA
jgi:hypothetical protein